MFTTVPVKCELCDRPATHVLTFEGTPATIGILDPGKQKKLFVCDQDRAFIGHLDGRKASR